MDPATAPTKVTISVPCTACRQLRVTLTLLTSYGSYYRCEACGHVWYEEQGERPRAST